MNLQGLYSKHIVYVLLYLLVSSAFVMADNWVGTWAASIQSVEAKLMPAEYQQLSDTTIRQVVRVSAGGNKLRIKLSNVFADWRDTLVIDQVSVAACAGGTAIDQKSVKQVTFNGALIVNIPYGVLIISDPVDFEVKASSDIVVNMHIQKAPKKTSGHRSARGEVVYIQSGNVVNSKELPNAAANKCWYFLSGVDVLSSSSGAAVICLGDSITDGKGSTEGANRRWPDFLARRLQANSSTRDIGVLNQGIGGNCLWTGGLGQTVLQRLDRDVLSQTSAKWVIVLEGINDLGGGKTSAEDIIYSFKQIVARSHSCGLKVYGSTILPCGNSFYYNEQLESKRQKINNWIRNSGKFDAVIDWDAVVRDPHKPENLLPETDCGDHLHLSDMGYQMLADSIDLDVFSR